MLTANIGKILFRFIARFYRLANFLGKEASAVQVRTDFSQRRGREHPNILGEHSFVSIFDGKENLALDRSASQRRWKRSREPS